MNISISWLPFVLEVILRNTSWHWESPWPPATLELQVSQGSSPLLSAVDWLMKQKDTYWDRLHRPQHCLEGPVNQVTGKSCRNSLQQKTHELVWSRHHQVTLGGYCQLHCHPMMSCLKSGLWPATTGRWKPLSQLTPRKTPLTEGAWVTDLGPSCKGSGKLEFYVSTLGRVDS